MKNLIITFVITVITGLVSNQGNAQTYEFVQNGDFSQECGTDFNDMPCFWNRRTNGSNQFLNFEEPVHVGKTLQGRVDAFFYTSIGSCVTQSLTCNGRTVDATDDEKCRPCNVNFLVQGDPGDFSASQCATETRLLGNTGSTADDHFLMLPPTTGSNVKGGIETHLGRKLCAGTYTLEFDLSIMMPVANSVFNFDIFLCKNQNNSDFEIFKLQESDGTSMTPGQWKHFSQQITISNEDDHKYQWIALRNPECPGTISQGTAHTIFVDNVSFKSNCILSEGACSPYIGDINPKFINTPESGTICVTGLQNAKDIKLEIFNATPQKIRTITINSPANTICWDEKTDAGVLVASGAYEARLTFSNACCAEKFTTNFIRPSNNQSNSAFLDYSSQDKVDKTNCCHPLIHITNETINDVRSYIGPDKIIIGPNVTLTNTADIYLQAATNIEFQQPITMQSGSLLEAVIEECDPPTLAVATPDDLIYGILLDSMKEQPSIGIDKITDWSLKPNPANESVTITLELPNNAAGNGILRLMDINGKVVHLKTINLEQAIHQINTSHLASGTYGVSISTNDMRFDPQRLIIVR